VFSWMSSKAKTKPMTPELQDNGLTLPFCLCPSPLRFPLRGGRGIEGEVDSFSVFLAGEGWVRAALPLSHSVPERATVRGNETQDNPRGPNRQRPPNPPEGKSPATFLPPGIISVGWGSCLVGKCHGEDAAVKKIIHAPAAIRRIKIRNGLRAGLVNVLEAASRNQRSKSCGDDDVVGQERTILHA